MPRTNNLVEPSISDYLNGLDPNEVIHRYCSIDEFYEILRGKLSLTCPYKWEDPFENPLFRAELTSRDGNQIPLREEGQKLYCQCWTLEGESDAMWKLYGARSRGVRITTLVKDLMLQAYNAYDYTAQEAMFSKIGMVNYLDEKETRKLFANEQEFVNRIMDPNCEGYYQSLLIKRKAYHYENEVRLIAHDFDGRFGDTATNRLSLPISCFDWIKSVTFGPAVAPDTLEAHRSRFSQFGFPSDTVSVSTLYGPLTYRIDLSRVAT